MADAAPPKRLVLDANILIRAVLGRRVRSIIDTYREDVRFFTPIEAFDDATTYLPPLFAKRGLDGRVALSVLDALRPIVQAVEEEAYLAFAVQAKARIRDLDDWPILALALALDAPVWTEDQDFFGAGIATWTTDHIEQFLRREP